MAKALVVDDSKAVRMILSRTLRDLGYEVLEAADGAEALHILSAEAGAPELALVDWNMPRMNGLELLTKIRQNPAWSSVAIVMVTTETDVDQMVAALDAGANEYVMKPFTREVLLEKLELLSIRR